MLQLANLTTLYLTAAVPEFEMLDWISKTERHNASVEEALQRWSAITDIENA